MQNTVSSLTEGFEKASARQTKDLNDMKQLLNEEVKDVRAANKQFSYELERN